MNLFQIGVFSLIIFIYVYAIVDRICKFKEQEALMKAYCAYLSCAAPEHIKNVDFIRDLNKKMPHDKK